MNRLGSMWTNPKMADHRAPMTRSQAFLNGVLSGIILGVAVAGGALTWFLILFEL